MKIPELGNDLDFDVHCKLERKKYAETLTNLLSGFDQGGVIALNNKWGTGKTTFVHMWRNYLKKKNFETIYFNAWENDFEDNPLAAIISELTTELQGNNEQLIETGAKLISNIATGVGKIVVDKVLGPGTTSTLKDINEFSDKDLLKKQIEDYKKKKESIKNFKKALSYFISNNALKPDKNTNVVFFIDELDRCRPNYAVKILEIIKHFFSVPNIIFVLSIDKEQLGHAICGVYGSDKIDTEEYLRRFIDIEYSLPIVDINKFIKHTLIQLDIETKLDALSERNSRMPLKRLIEILFINNTLRQIEKICSHLKIIIRSISINDIKTLDLLLFILYLKYNKKDKYLAIINREIEIEDYNDFFFDIYQSSKELEKDPYIACKMEAFLLLNYIYGDSATINQNMKKIKQDYPKKVYYTSRINKESFEEHFYEADRYNNSNINYIINFIELVTIY